MMEILEKAIFGRTLFSLADAGLSFQENTFDDCFRTRCHDQIAGYRP